MSKYRAYVTIMGELENEDLDFLDLFMELETDDFEEAERFYQSVNVQPFGALAYALHANHPEFVRLEADYDLEGDPYDVDGVAWFINESIWWEE